MPLDPLEITGGLAIGTGLGGAIEDTVKPRLENFRKGQWAAHPDKALDPGAAAEVAAENYGSYGSMATEASYSGYDAERFQWLYDVTVTGPGMGELLAMLRRGTISSANFVHGLQKARLEPMWHDPLAELATAYVGLGDIAYGVVRGILPAPSWVPVAPPTSGDKVPRFPVVNIDPTALAAKLGYSEDMLKLMVGRSGLSMAPGMAAQALFRNIIGPKDYLLAIAEGDLRTEWATPLREVSRQILTASQYVEGYLRGWATQQEMYAGTAKHGMTQADTDLLFEISGRPITVHEITTGLARGGNYPSTYADVPEPYRKAIQESNVRPEWADLHWRNRYTYPSGFQVRAEAQQGNLTSAETEQILLEMGWVPKWATHFSQAWTGGTASGGDSHVSKAQTQLWNTAHRSYVGEMIDAATATTAIEAAGVAAGSASAVLALWGHERALTRKQLTPAQIRKAVNEGVINPATGAAWTVQQGIAALEERGYDPADAQTFMQS